MKFRDLTASQSDLRGQVIGLEKQALLGSVVKAVGGLAGKALGGAAKGLHNTAWRASGRVAGGNKLLQGLTYGAGVLGMGTAASNAAQKAKQYRQGFDPRVQAMKLRGR